MKLWSVSTTVRNPERIRGFLGVLTQLEGCRWDVDTQKRYQILLVKNRLYGYEQAEFMQSLSEEHKNWLVSPEFTEQQAKIILESKNYEGGIEMRGRQSFNPIKKMGLAYLADHQIVRISPFGKYLLQEDYDIGEVFFRSFLKWQYPNPDALSDYPASDYNIKPFVATLHLIGDVNKLCEQQGLKAKGVSRIEFALFFTTLTDYQNIQKTAERLVEFRKEYSSQKNTIAETTFAEKYFQSHFNEFQSWKNAKDYADNIIRNFRLTRYFHLRGNEYYIDWEPRRNIEIESIIANDTGAALTFDNKQHWYTYLGDTETPVLPWENTKKLNEIRTSLLQEIDSIHLRLHNSQVKVSVTPILSAGQTPSALIEDNKILREYRRKLLNMEIHDEMQQINNVETYIDRIVNIHRVTEGRPVEFEYLVASGLQALNDALEIKPNYPVADDNTPTFTAPANHPDIECYYQTFNAICEVTLLKNRAQWFNEGQPVMRHLRDFENKNSAKSAYCLFIAPSLHADTINTFWISTKYEYEGRKQSIVPLKIQQFCDILQVLVILKKSNRPFTHQMLGNLFFRIAEETPKQVSSSQEWIQHIPSILIQWKNEVTEK